MPPGDDTAPLDPSEHRTTINSSKCMPAGSTMASSTHAMCLPWHLSIHAVGHTGMQQAPAARHTTYGTPPTWIARLSALVNFGFSPLSAGGPLGGAPALPSAAAAAAAPADAGATPAAAPAVLVDTAEPSESTSSAASWMGSGLSAAAAPARGVLPADWGRCAPCCLMPLEGVTGADLWEPLDAPAAWKRLVTDTCYWRCMQVMHAELEVEVEDACAVCCIECAASSGWCS
jgi:hypothetical protein